MASVITATNSSGLTTSADNSGVLQLASGTGNLVTVPSVTGTAMVSGNMPAFSATIGSSQSLSAATTTKLQYNTEAFDTNSNYDTSNYRFTPTVAGYYQINLCQEYSAQTGVQNVQIYKNGGRVASGGSYASNIGTFFSSTSVLVFLNGSTDYVEAYGFTLQASTAFSGSSSSFSASLVRAA